MINIIDIGLGNITSLEYWINSCNLFSKRVSTPSEFSNDIIVIPGVASAKEFMRRLRLAKLDQEIIQRSANGQKIVGICLGFQILTDFSQEDGGVKCLGLLKGKTVFLRSRQTNNGWKNFRLDGKIITEKYSSHIYLSAKKKRIVSGRVYFNHAFEVILENQPDIYSQTSDNGITSLAFNKNIFGFQFHPEKSQETGKELLKLLI